MSLEEYMGELKGQIRDKNARILVSDEIYAHIEEQADSYQKNGIDREEALSKVVEEMGDPVSVGADLDRIHRPHMEWRYLTFILFISVLSILVQYLITKNIDSESVTGSILGDLSRRHFVGIMAGIIAMLLVYRADYTILIGRSRLIGGIFIVIVTILTATLGYRINGMSGWVSIGSVSFSMRALMLLYLPLFAGILYELRGGGRWGIAQIIFWMILPALSTFITGDLSAPFTLLILLSETILVFIAVHKDWYGINRKIVYGGFATVFALMITAGAVFIYRLNGYQSARLANWLAHFGIGNRITDDNGINYVNAQLGKAFASSAIIGKSEEAVDIMSNTPGFGSDYVVGSVAATCGLLAVAVIIICMLALAIYMVRISVGQKNSLGFIVGCACGITIAIQSISNILIVFGLLPMTSSVLPIFTSRISFCIVDYMLIGLVLSIYRYKDIRRDVSRQTISNGGNRELVV